MRCAACGHTSEEGLRFCGWCGEPLAGPQHEERKTVSAVFCDLVGYTSRTEGKDPEDVQRLVSDYCAAVLPEFERFGGTLAREFGDGLMILYGWPRAHEDDPERAVRAALASLDALARLNAGRPELDMHVHVGVTTGETLVRLDAADAAMARVWGASLGTAFRLEDAATADEILVDDPTYRATKHAIEYRAVEPVKAKGMSAPVIAWRPLAPRARRGLDLREHATAPLVGRDAELQPLLDGLRLALAAQGPQLVTLVGDAGIGKSRLVFELFRAVEEGTDLVNWRHGRSPAYPAGMTFWALGEIVKRQAGMLDTDDAAMAEDKLARAVRELDLTPAEVERIEPHLRSLVGVSGPADSGREGREAAFAAWRHFIEALARKRPLVLAFEDLHWAGEGLLDFVEYVHEWVDELPLLIVCTARRELAERCREWGTRPGATTIELEPLADSHTHTLVTSLPGAAAIPAGTRERIVAKASGNPLYSVELVRMLSGRDLAGAGGEEELPLPESVRAIITARLDALALEDKQLLQIGSVSGTAVWPSALAAVADRSTAWAIERLGALEQRQFLTRGPRSSVAGEPEYRFEHALIRDAAYNGIPRPQRIRFHERLAEWTELLSPDRAVDRAEMLAHHYSCAYQLARETGADTRSLAPAAMRALRAAGDRAVALQDFPAAEGYFRRALMLCPDDDLERAYLQLRLGKALYRAETSGAAELAKATAALEAIGDPGAAAEAETFLAYLAHHDGRRDELDAHLDRAMALVGASGPSASKAEVLVDVANIRSMARQHEQTVVAGEEAIAIADELGLPELKAHALSSIGISRALAGDARGRDDLERAVSIMEEIDSHLSAHVLGMLADLDGQMGALTSCFELQARARDRAVEAGHAGWVRWLDAEMIGRNYWSGAWDEAIAAADRFVEEAERGSAHFMLGYCRTLRGRMRLARADADGARADAVAALEFARRAEDLQMLYPALAFAARAEVEAGSRDAGSRLAGELLELWRSKLDLYPTSSWAIDLACALGPLDRSAELLAVARDVRTRSRWLDAVVAFAGGDFVAAAEHFAAIGSRPDEALAGLRAAVTLAAGGRRRDAEAQLVRAAEFFSAVGAGAYLAEIAAARAAVAPGGGTAIESSGPSTAGSRTWAPPPAAPTI